MKKLLTILLTILLLAGCSSNAVKTATEKAITNYKALLNANMKEAANEESDIDAEYTLAFMEAVYDFDYKIKNVEVNENTATATVIIKTMNIVSFIDAYSQDQEVVDADNKLMTETDETKVKEYITVLTNKLKEYIAKTPKDYETEVSIPLVKEDGSWVVDSSYDLESNLSTAIVKSALDTGE